MLKYVDFNALILHLSKLNELTIKSQSVINAMSRAKSQYWSNVFMPDIRKFVFPPLSHIYY